jgi:hypothetical protein
MRWITAAVSLAVLAGACSDENKPDEGAAGLLAGIDGTWRGYQSVIDSAGDMITKKVEFSFNAKQKFQMTLVDDAQSATGNYTDFQKTKYLVLNIEESSIPSLGLKGDGRDFTYDLADNELVLKADKSSYKLLRSTSSEPAKEEPKALEGGWVGEDSNGNHWQLEATSNDFYLAVTRGRALMMSGPVIYLDAAGASKDVKARCLLTVTKSIPSKQVDFMLAVVGNGVTIYRADERGKIVLDEPMAELKAAKNK